MSTLPEELLQHIFSNLVISGEPVARNEDGVKLSALANISLANKTCYRIVRPHLYNTVVLEGYTQTDRRRQILRTLLDYPDAREMVQKIHAGGWSTKADSQARNEQCNPAPDDLKSKMLAATDAALPASTRSRMLQELEEGVEDAEIALLLLLSPKLRLLDFSAAFRISQSLTVAVVQLAHPVNGQEGELARPLQLLSEVRVGYDDTEDALDVGDVAATLQLPALETFRGRMIACDHESTGAILKLKSQLKRLYLESSLLDALGLERLMVACPSLETISMHWGSAIVGASEIEYTRIGQALRRHGSKLKNLRFKPEQAESFDEDIDRDSPLGSLKELESLRLLAVPYAALCGARPATDPNYLLRNLPTSLRTLNIADAEVPKVDESDIESSDEDEEDADDTNALDMQLIQVMQDEKFTELSTIRVQRAGGFTLSAMAEEAGWADKGGRFWIMLKRLRPVVA